MDFLHKETLEESALCTVEEEIVRDCRRLFPRRFTWTFLCCSLYSLLWNLFSNFFYISGIPSNTCSGIHQEVSFGTSPEDLLRFPQKLLLVFLKQILLKSMGRICRKNTQDNFRNSFWDSEVFRRILVGFFAGCQGVS